MSVSKTRQRNAPESAELAFPVLLLAGPTASGKSAVALSVAEKLDGTIINADSVQVYRELRILSNRPSAADEARVRHRLFGVFSATDECSAARWCALALTEIAAAHEAGRLPIVVGGTGLYLKTLLEGLSPIPDVPAEIRSHLKRRLAEEGSAALHAELVRRDPATANRLEPEDSQRVMRALEVLDATGSSITDFQAQSKAGPPSHLLFSTVLLQPSRDVLYARCDSRLARMIEAGAIDEVRRLQTAGLDPGLPIMKALGVVEIGSYLDGLMPLERALKEAQQATRRYAKRQTTWFRTQIIADLVSNAQDSERFEEEIFSFIRQKMLTGAE
jgi:tRNA dimethylallyltransferase